MVNGGGAWGHQDETLCPAESVFHPGGTCSGDGAAPGAQGWWDANHGQPSHGTSPDEVLCPLLEPTRKGVTQTRGGSRHPAPSRSAPPAPQGEQGSTKWAPAWSSRLCAAGGQAGDDPLQ